MMTATQELIAIQEFPGLKMEWSGIVGIEEMGNF